MSCSFFLVQLKTAAYLFRGFLSIKVCFDSGFPLHLAPDLINQSQFLKNAFYFKLK